MGSAALRRRMMKEENRKRTENKGGPEEFVTEIGLKETQGCGGIGGRGGEEKWLTERKEKRKRKGKKITKKKITVRLKIAHFNFQY